MLWDLLTSELSNNEKHKLLIQNQIISLFVLELTEFFD